jgi:hypothetical protein
MAKPIPLLLLVLSLTLPAGAALAVTVDDLLAAGFSKVKETRVTGDFNGCDRDVHVQLEGLNDFVCTSYSHMYAQHPKAVLMRSKTGGQYKLLINGTVFDGLVEGMK